MNRSELLAQLQSDRNALLADIAERQVENDIAETLAPVVQAPPIIYKQRRPSLPDDAAGDLGVVTDNEKAMLEAIVDHVEARVAPLREQISELKGQVAALTAILGVTNAARSAHAKRRVQRP